MLDATVGGQTSNSYVTVAEADAYFALHPLKDEWDKVTNKEAYLVKATRDIDRLPYKFKKATPEQSLEFPRTNNPTVIPQKVKYATAEQALYLFLNEDKFIHLMNYENGIGSFNQGKNQRSYTKKPDLLCYEAKEFLNPYILRLGRLK